MDVAQWIAIGVAIAVSVLLVTIVHWLLTHQLSRVWGMADPLVRRCRNSGYLAAAVVGANIALPTRAQMADKSLYPLIMHGMRILMIGALTWLALSIAYAITDMVLSKLAAKNRDDDGRSRRLQTQVRLLRRIAATIIGVLAVAAILFTFPAVQGIGAGLLASAGLLSVVAGSGLQLAFSDALRITDVIVFEGEWGRVEELSLTNVTLRIWDERRLVVPVSHFTNNAFENWTKQGASITGWVMLRLDWSVPIERIRQVTGNYVTNHPLWDGRRWSLQATDILDGGVVELRAVVTTADSDARWNLCCDLREHLVTFISENVPEAVPRRRTEFIGGEEQPPYAAVFPESAFRRSTPRASAVGNSGGPNGSLRTKGSRGEEAPEDGDGGSEGE